MILTRVEFIAAVDHSTELFNELKADYPELRLYPVFSRFGPGSGQCPLTTDTAAILTEFPEMLLVDKKTALVGRKLRELKKAKKNKITDTALLKEAIARLRSELPAPLSAEGYSGDVNVELRCGTLIYTELRKLQQDFRLPQDLNTIGNIRVNMGLLENLSRRESKA